MLGFGLVNVFWSNDVDQFAGDHLKRESEEWYCTVVAYIFLVWSRLLGRAMR